MLAVSEVTWGSLQSVLSCQGVTKCREVLQCSLICVYQQIKLNVSVVPANARIVVDHVIANAVVRAVATDEVAASHVTVAVETARLVRQTAATFLSNRSLKTAAITESELTVLDKTIITRPDSMVANMEPLIHRTTEELPLNDSIDFIFADGGCIHQSFHNYVLQLCGNFVPLKDRSS